MISRSDAAVLFIVGPTAAGKTAAAFTLAASLAEDGSTVEIINADSRQVYRGMSIGTAKPTVDQLGVVRHHLIDIVDPSDGFNLATFLALARHAIDDVLARGGIPIVVGGTGQYVWGIAEGWRVPEVAPQAELRELLEQEAREVGADALHARLARLDPTAADLISPSNVRRLVRALEVVELTGKPFSTQRRRQTPTFEQRVLGLDVPPETLRERIDHRVDAMVKDGWLDEVRALLDAGYGPELPAFSSAGYRELAAHVRGDMSSEEAVVRTKNATHRLARAQRGWFKRADPRITWLPDADSLLAAARPTTS